MASCHACGTTVGLPYQCRRCGKEFCGDHRLPESHLCVGLLAEPDRRESTRWPSIPVRTVAIGAVAVLAIVGLGLAVGTLGFALAAGDVEAPSLPSIGPDDLDADTTERAVLEAINEYRVANGLGELTHDETLATAAGGHSADMVERDFYGHETPEGHGPGDRVDTCARPDEVIATSWWYREYTRWDGETVRNTDAAGVADSVLVAWQSSDDHDAALRDPAYTRAGAGVAVADDNEVFVTVKLC